jgi:hypothetical protein
MLPICTLALLVLLLVLFTSGGEQKRSRRRMIYPLAAEGRRRGATGGRAGVGATAEAALSGTTTTCTRQRLTDIEMKEAGLEFDRSVV